MGSQETAGGAVVVVIRGTVVAEVGVVGGVRVAGGTKYSILLRRKSKQGRFFAAVFIY